MSAAVLTPPGAPAAPQPAAALPPAPPLPAPDPLTTAGAGATADLRRFSVDEYHKMLEVGIFVCGEPVELLDGLVVQKMPTSTDHATATRLVAALLREVVPAGWFVDEEKPLTIQPRSEPEPDASVIRGRSRDYLRRHPNPADTALVVEVSYSSYARDRGEKWAIYARDGVPVYWIVNLEVTPPQLEVYSHPVNGEYTQSVTLTAADRADVVLDGQTVGTVAVAELLP